MGYMQATLVKLGLAQPGPKITAHDRAVLDLKVQRDKLRQYQKRIQVVLDREQEIARESLKAGDKRKFQEQLLARTDEQLHTLQDLVQTIEFTQIQTAVVHGLEQGSAVLSQLQAEMSLDKVERLMDRTAAGVEYQREIDAALQSQMSSEEEDAVLAELEAMEREALLDATADQQPRIPDVPVGPVDLPEAPTAEPSELVEVEEAQPAAATSEARVAMMA